MFLFISNKSYNKKNIKNINFRFQVKVEMYLSYHNFICCLRTRYRTERLL